MALPLVTRPAHASAVQQSSRRIVPRAYQHVTLSKEQRSNAQHSNRQMCPPATARNLCSTTCKAQSTASTSVAAAPEAAVGAIKIQVAVPLQDARQSLRLDLVQEGKGQAIQIASVRPGSMAEQLGVRAGQRIRSIMDPVRSGEMLPLKDKPSLRFVTDVINMTMRAEVVMELDTSFVQAAAEGISLQSSTPADPSAAPSTSTIAEQLASRYASLLEDGSISSQSVQSIPLIRQPTSRSPTAGQGRNGNNDIVDMPAPSTLQGPADSSQMTDVQKRIQKRKDYMEVVGERNDIPFFAMLAAAFLLPAAVILGVAYYSGYLDQLYSHSLSTMS